MSEQKNEIMVLRYRDYYCISNSYPFRMYRCDYKKPSIKKTNDDDLCDDKGRPNQVVMMNGFNFCYKDKNGKTWDIMWKGF